MGGGRARCEVRREEVEEAGALRCADVVVLVLWANVAKFLFRIVEGADCAASCIVYTLTSQQYY